MFELVAVLIAVCLVVATDLILTKVRKRTRVTVVEAMPTDIEKTMPNEEIAAEGGTDAALS